MRETAANWVQWQYAGNGIPGPVSTRLVFGHLNTVKLRIVKPEFRYVEVKRLCNAEQTFISDKMLIYKYLTIPFFLVNYYQILNHEGTARTESKESIYVPTKRWHIT